MLQHSASSICTINISQPVNYILHDGFRTSSQTVAVSNQHAEHLRRDDAATTAAIKRLVCSSNGITELMCENLKLGYQTGTGSIDIDVWRDVGVCMPFPVKQIKVNNCSIRYNAKYIQYKRNDEMNIYNDDDEHGNTVTTKLVVMSRVIQINCAKTPK